MLIESLAEKLIATGQTLSTVESCTGGGIAACCTDIAGSSVWFLGAVVTYSNEMKVRLGVEAKAIAEFGAVSEVVVRQMAKTGLNYCSSDWSVAVSGIAGPGGASADKPVGTVWFAWASATQCITERKQFSGNRADVRRQTVDYAIEKLIELLA